MESEKSTYPYKFSIDDIVRFCVITGDSNNIHDPKYMAGFGKLPIVPGMFTLFRSIAGVNTLALKDIKKIEAYFADPLSPGECINLGGTIGTIIRPEPQDIELIAQINGQNALENRGRASKLVFDASPKEKQVLGMESTYDVNYESLASFSHLIGVPLPSVSRTFYAVAFASHAMLESLKAKDTSKLGDDASELAKGFADTDKKILPVYTSFSIEFPNGAQGVMNPRYPLDYTMNVVKISRRDYQINLACHQSGKQVFNGQYDIKAIAERIIIDRLAKDIPKK